MSLIYTFSTYETQVYEGTHPMYEGVNKYESAAAMLFFSYPEMKELHAQIDPDDVCGEDGFGLELAPHCSLLVGIDKAVRPQPVLQLIQSFPIPDLRLKNVSTFPPRPASLFEVLKFDIKAPGLHEINKAIRDTFPYNTPFPYHPHATIAYLKKGMAAKYVDMFHNVETRAEVQEIVYSKVGGKMIRVFL